MRVGPELLGDSGKIERDSYNQNQAAKKLLLRRRVELDLDVARRPGVMGYGLLIHDCVLLLPLRTVF